MKKKKVKALRKRFLEVFGREPKKATFDEKGNQIQLDEFRRFKKFHSKR